MAVYNHYQGNTGRVRRVDDSRGEPKGQARHGERPRSEQRDRPQPPAAGRMRPASNQKGVRGELERLLRRLSSHGLDTEDIIIILILYLLYRDSGDEEFLIMIAGMLLL